MARAPDESDALFVPAGASRAGVPPEIGVLPSRFFPPPTAATVDGLVCIGGRLSPEWLLDAYRHGIFPWPMWDDEPMAWWSLDPRAIIELDDLHISRRLRRALKHGRFGVTCDRDFTGVIHGCATGNGREGGTWLTPAMIAAYCEMHRLGHAHSVEVWLPTPKETLLPSPTGRGAGGEGEAARNPPHPNSLPPRRIYDPKGEGMFLAGGIYGVAIGGLFAAESMFYRVRDASKVALAHLVAHLRSRGYCLLDIQQWTPHTGSLGAIEIPRLEYLRKLAEVIDLPITFGAKLESSPLI
jgi:leucyl/phenylalanyl-tRNA--protein transferase